MAGPPTTTPLGLELSQTAKLASRAFDDALAAAGGSLPTWHVLVSVMAGQHGRQGDIAAAIGVEGATLTHHLNRLEADGLVRRERDPNNRRRQQVTLTDAGVEKFHALRAAATSFDKQLRSGLSADDVATLRSLLARIRDNVAPQVPA